MSERLENTPVGEIVATDFRAAAVFARFGIDFCCGGRRSLADACSSVSTDPAEVIRALNALPRSAARDDDVTQWPLDRLIEHIVTVHHRYVRRSLPVIGGYLAKLCDVHGGRHPELGRIARVFDEIGDELRQHLLKEEQVLFPYIRELVQYPEDACGSRMSPFGSVENPIRMMESEHREAAGAVRLIRELTHDYVSPADGCTTYGVCMAELREFERDLHRHMHLENNVLFPRAVTLEQRSLSHDRN